MLLILLLYLFAVLQPTHAIEPSTQAESNVPTQQRFFFTGNLGLTGINYKQSRVAEYDQTMITLRAAGSYLINEHWELSTNAFINAISLTSNHPDSIRFFGLNGRVGYIVHETESKWKIILNGGWYYLTSYAKQAVGFKNLSGPQIFPMLRHAFSERENIFAYFKYSPISSSFSLLNLRNREMAVGSGYVFLWGGQLFTAGLDIAMLWLNFAGADMRSNSYTASLGISF